MKTPPLIALALFLLFAKPTSAADGPSFPLIRTNSGKVYVNCSVFKTHPDGVVIAFENGGAKVLYSDLSPELRTVLGYDPEKEAAYDKECAEKKRKEQQEREELAKHRADMARVQVAAYEAEAARYQFMVMQGGSGGYAGGGSYPYAGGYALGYPYAGDYPWGYTYYNAGYFPNYGYRVESASDCYGYGGLPNNLYPYNGGIGIGSMGYGNGYDCGPGAYGTGRVTRGGVTYPVPCRTNWNGSNGWNGNGGRHGNSFNGYNSRSRASCGTPPLNGIGRPLYNIPTPCHIPTPCRAPVATPAIGRFSPATGSCVRR